MDQSDDWALGLFSRWTNRTPPAVKGCQGFLSGDMEKRVCVTQLGRVAPPNIDDQFSFLDQAVLVLRNLEDRHLEPLDRAKMIDIR
eukprot:4475244-Pyramimonas_sp.AAC.1